MTSGFRRQILYFVCRLQLTFVFFFLFVMFFFHSISLTKWKSCFAATLCVSNNKFIEAKWIKCQFYIKLLIWRSANRTISYEIRHIKIIGKDIAPSLVHMACDVYEYFDLWMVKQSYDIVLSMCERSYTTINCVYMFTFFFIQAHQYDLLTIWLINTCDIKMIHHQLYLFDAF